MTEQLRQRCIEALHVWLHQYAGELCDPLDVKHYMLVLRDHGGTLAYISQLLADLDVDVTG